MSTYRCENLSLCENEFFDDYFDLIEYIKSHNDNRLAFYELCKDCETEFNIDYGLQD